MLLQLAEMQYYASPRFGTFGGANYLDMCVAMNIIITAVEQPSSLVLVIFAFMNKTQIESNAT